MFTPDRLTEIILLIPPLLFSLTIHEYAHARTALAFGDATAKLLGRVSLNPLRHLDPIGTVAIFLVRFGWAKPVPVNHMNLRPRRLGDIAVSLAGPLSNFALALAAIFLLRGLLGLKAFRDWPSANLAVHVFWLTITINLVLCVFNLIPLYPLDGHHILRELLPVSQQQQYMEWQLRFGRMLLLAVIFLPRLLRVPGPLSLLFGYVITPLVDALLFLV